MTNVSMLPFLDTATEVHALLMAALLSNCLHDHIIHDGTSSAIVQTLHIMPFLHCYYDSCVVLCTQHAADKQLS